MIGWQMVPLFVVLDWGQKTPSTNLSKILKGVCDILNIKVYSLYTSIDNLVKFKYTVWIFSSEIVNSTLKILLMNWIIP